MNAQSLQKQINAMQAQLDALRNQKSSVDAVLPPRASVALDLQKQREIVTELAQAAGRSYKSVQKSISTAFRQKNRTAGQKFHAAAYQIIAGRNYLRRGVDYK